MSRDIFFVCIAQKDGQPLQTQIKAVSDEDARATFEIDEPDADLISIHGPYFKLPPEWWKQVPEDGRE